MIYIYQGQIVENNHPIDEIVRSYIFEENNFAHVILNDKQIERSKDKTLTIEQVFYGKDYE